MSELVNGHELIDRGLLSAVHEGYAKECPRCGMVEGVIGANPFEQTPCPNPAPAQPATHRRRRKADPEPEKEKAGE